MWIEDRTVRLILQKLTIKQRLGSVYHPQSQGAVERMNGVLKNRISKICQQTGLNWVAALPLALMVCRLSELHDLHLTPHELIMPRRVPSPHLWISNGHEGHFRDIDLQYAQNSKSCSGE